MGYSLNPALRAREGAQLNHRQIQGTPAIPESATYSAILFLRSPEAASRADIGLFAAKWGVRLGGSRDWGSALSVEGLGIVVAV